MKPLLTWCLVASAVGALGGWGVGWQRAAAEHRVRTQKENAAADVAAKLPGTLLAQVVQDADFVVIDFDPRPAGSESSFSDRQWLGRLAETLKLGRYAPQEHCLCVSFPEIHFFRQGTEIATFSVHHATKLRAYPSVVSGDFYVGVDTAKAIVDLAREKQIREVIPPR